MKCTICQHDIFGVPMTIGLPEADGRHVSYVEPVCANCHQADGELPDGMVCWGDDGVELTQ